MKKVLVLGGGIAGVEAASLLSEYGFDVTLVSNRDYYYIYPLAIWIPVERIKFNDIKMNLNNLALIHNFRFIKDEVLSIKAKEKEVLLKESGSLKDFDYLVIAIGGSKVNPKGMEYAYSICSEPTQALELRDAIQKLVLKGSGKIAIGFGGNPKDPSGVRGGPAFELLLNLDDYLRKLNLRENFQITFFAPMDKPGIRLGEKAYNSAMDMLKKLNINIKTGKKIKEFQKDGVVLEDGEKIEADVIAFIPATDGHKAIKESDLPQNEAGFIKIDDTTKVIDFDYVYAIGDSAALEGPDWKAKQGHLAEAMARVCAFNIALKEGKAKGAPKSYKEHMSIICLMDMGTKGAGLVYRNDKKAIFLPMPIIGHYLKKLWGMQFKLVKMKKLPKLPYINY
jgi:sulfide:quinone oxidoreductase